MVSIPLNIASSSSHKITYIIPRRQQKGALQRLFIS
jgi:hypothetical protein